MNKKTFNILYLLAVSILITVSLMYLVYNESRMIQARYNEIAIQCNKFYGVNNWIMNKGTCYPITNYESCINQCAPNNLTCAGNCFIYLNISI